MKVHLLLFHPCLLRSLDAREMGFWICYSLLFFLVGSKLFSDFSIIPKGSKVYALRLF